MAAGTPAGKTGSFPIVGIAASAGGLETFQEILRSLPADSGGMPHNAIATGAIDFILPPAQQIVACWGSCARLPVSSAPALHSRFAA